MTDEQAVASTPGPIVRACIRGFLRCLAVWCYLATLWACRSEWWSMLRHEEVREAFRRLHTEDMFSLRRSFVKAMTAGGGVTVDEANAACDGIFPREPPQSTFVQPGVGDA